MKQEFKKSMQEFEQKSIYKEGMRNHALSFSWNHAASQYWDIYEEMIQKLG